VTVVTPAVLSMIRVLSAPGAKVSGLCGFRPLQWLCFFIEFRFVGFTYQKYAVTSQMANAPAVIAAVLRMKELEEGEGGIDY
jgi:hypothetical protein